MKKYLIVIIGLIIATTIYNSNMVMIQMPIMLDNVTKNNLKFYEKSKFLMKTIDDINPFKGEHALNSFNLPVINISMNRKLMKGIVKSVWFAENSNPYCVYMSDNFNTYKKTSMYIGKDKYKIKLKLHGVGTPNFINEKKSFTIKIRNKNKKFYKGMRKFALLLPEEFNGRGIFADKLSQRFNLLHPKIFPVILKINGISQGLYFLEEKLSKELLERNNLAGVDVIKRSDEVNHQYVNGHMSIFQNLDSNLEINLISKKNIGQKEQFSKLMNAKDYNQIKQLIDVDTFSKHEALRVITYDGEHSVLGNNIKFLYNTSVAKFSIYYRMENSLRKIPIYDSAMTIDRALGLAETSNGVYSTTNDLFYKLIKSNEFRKKRNVYLWELIKDKNKILKLFDKINQETNKLILADTTNDLPGRAIIYYVNMTRVNLIANMEIAEKYLKYARVFIDFKFIKNKEYTITINPDSNVGVKIKRLILNLESKENINKIYLLDKKDNRIMKFSTVIKKDGNISVDISNFFENQSYMLSLDDSLNPMLNPTQYTIYSDVDFKINNIEVTSENILTGKEISKMDTYTSINNDLRLYQDDNISIESFLQKYKDFGFLKVNNNRIKWSKGHYTITNNMVFPYGYNLTIEKGTIIEISKGKSILIYSGIDIKGTQKEPVKIINNQENAFFGTLSAVGDGETLCNIENLEIYGGSETFINGMHLSGALSLYNHKNVNIKNSLIHHNGADDGLNIKNSNILLIGNTFNANMADQVDLDFCKGTLKNNKFIKKSLFKDSNIISIPIDNNGDGLDFSGSKMIVKNNYFDGFLDKGISIGENTLAFIDSNNFIHNRSAITVKDESKVYLYSNNYNDNNFSIEMYQKKKMFAHPSVFNINDKIIPKKIRKTDKSHYFKLKNNKLKIKKEIYTLDIFEKLNKKDWIEYE